ncbi:MULTISPECIES: tetratricopeptide repeat protein [Persicobacter]|uniref:OmpA-like domain-containing protein n=1 Tax=Persicobacter diffluens TaxID=981 RepID=A0AAN4VVJ8_9BACT|nr:hypothetical protein [Persicobacter sp. CCB-QB2]GJM59851.1 hypothetical protein PEDI_04030 [Persicobacter diffluens]
MRKLVFPAAVLGAMMMSGCSLNKMAKMAKDQELTVTPNPLEVHADTVQFEMSAVLPVKMLKPGLEYQMEPSYNYGEKSETLSAVTLKGDDWADKKDQNPRLSESFAFAYNDEMSSGELAIAGKAVDPKKNKIKEGPVLPVAKGVITTSQLVEDVYAPAYLFHGYNNQEELIPTNVEFFFTQGSSVLRWSEKTSERGKFLDAFVADKNVTRTVIITGTHSPEGTERNNSRLAENRATVIEKEYRKLMKRYDYKGTADSIKFVLKPVVDDWAEFKKELEAYDGVDASVKSELLSIVNGAGSFEEKEKQMQKVNGYRKVFKDVYPKLRTAKTEILTVKEKKTDAEIATLSKQIQNNSVNADTLSLEELMYSATLTPSVSEKEAIYAAATKKADSHIAHNNLGAAYLASAAEAEGSARAEMVEKAMTQFELSNRKQETAEATANMAVAAYLAGDDVKAFNLIEKAYAMGLESENAKSLAGVKAALEIKRAKYADAVASLANADDAAANLYNKGLAQLLNKQYDAAVVSFQEAAEKDSNFAAAFYGEAIANARAGKEDAAIAALKKSVAAEPEMAKKAVNDLEFSKFSASEAFRNALK